MNLFEGEMSVRDVLNRHSALAGRMAEAAGADLAAALADGRLSEGELRNAIYRCTGCDEPGACEDWLASHEGEKPGATPGYCRNSAMFARLRG
ncbi:MAG: DUF6455 family protein [Paracoccaceae bacterium]